MSGGVNGVGTVFELASGSSVITDLTSFDGGNGSYPTAGLIMDSSGNFYGTTFAGGVGSDDSDISGDGSVFELRPHTPALSWPTPGSINLRHGPLQHATGRQCCRFRHGASRGREIRLHAGGRDDCARRRRNLERDLHADGHDRLQPDHHQCRRSLSFRPRR